jgi:hypothetical protein
MSEQGTEETQPQEPVTEPDTQEPVTEPEPDTTEPDAEPAPAETPEPDEQPAPQPVPPSQTPEALEKRTRSAEQRWNRYAQGIEGLYEGSEVRLIGCPLCPEQHKGFVDLNFAGRIPEEIEANVKAYLGLAREIEYRPSRKYHTCEECGGEGKVSTGSHVPTAKAITCEECEGRGYNPKPGYQQPNGLTGPTAFTPAELEAATQAHEDRDEWGEPRILPDGRENPNFGRMPNRKVLVEPWGVTANLTALDSVR